MSLKLHSRGENRNSCLLCLFFKLAFFKFSTSVSGETSRSRRSLKMLQQLVFQPTGSWDRLWQNSTDATKASDTKCPSSIFPCVMRLFSFCCLLLPRSACKAKVFTTSSRRLGRLRETHETWGQRRKPPPAPSTGGLWVEGGRQTSSESSVHSDDLLATRGRPRVSSLDKWPW